MARFLIFLLFSFKANANVVGADFQNFNPTSNGLDFVTVQSSETLNPGIINFGYFINYAVNTLPYFEDTNTAQSEYNDYLLTGDLNIGIGLGANWDIGLNLPHLLGQEVESSDVEHGEFIDTGLTEIRFSTKYRFFGDSSYGMAAVLTSDFNQVKGNPYLGEDPGIIAILELVGDITLGKWALGANIGYRYREEGEQNPDFPEIEPYGNSFIASLAASYLINSIDTKIISEFFAGYPESGSSNRTGREESSAEFLMGLKKDWTTKFSTHFGASTELFNGTASPDYRIYAGINWATGPYFFKEEKKQSKEVISENINLNLPEEEGMPEIEKIEGGEIYKLTKVLFEFASPNKAVGAARDNLDAMAKRIKSKPFTQIVIVGHTDSVGSDEYNKKLSVKRAATVGRYLISRHGFKKTNMRVIGYGENKPIADNGNYQGRAQNRRVEVIVMEVGRWRGYPDDYGYNISIEDVEEKEAPPKKEVKLPTKLPPKKVQ